MIRPLKQAAAIGIGLLCAASIGQFLAGGGAAFLACALLAAWNAWRLLRTRPVLDPVTGRPLTDADYQKILDWLDDPSTATKGE